jgi:hypothetical protein
VELEIEKNPRSEGGELLNQCRTVGGKRFEPDLEPSDFIYKGRRGRSDPAEVTAVESDTERVLGVHPTSGLSAIFRSQFKVYAI